MRRILPFLLLLIALLLPAIASTAQEEASGEVIRESYSSGQLRLEAEVVRDSLGDPVYHGMYRAWHENGGLAVEGKYQDGVRVGKWQSFHENVELESSGLYRRGFRIQKWVYRDENGKRGGDSGKYTPVFEEYASGRRKSAGEHRGKPRHGSWIWWYESGQIACEGRYHIDNRSGTWSWYRPDGSLRLRGDYTKGRREGNWTYTHANGYADPEFLSGSYRKGKRLGAHSELSLMLPELDVTALRPPTPLRILSDRDRERIERHVRNYARTQAPSDVNALLEWEHMALPSILGSLRDSKLQDEKSQLVGWRLSHTLLRNASGGHTLGWNVQGSPEAFAENRRTCLRWLSLWELTHDDESFWRASREADPMSGGDYLAWLAETIEIGPFAPEDRPERIEVVEHVPVDFEGLRRRYGGGGTSDALDAAIGWLIAHQGAFGGWGAHDFPLDCPPEEACGGQGQSTHDMGVTGLAVLALLGAGNTMEHEEHPGGSAALRRAAEWMRKSFDARQGLMGEYVSHDFIYGHAIATIALCELASGHRDPLLDKMARSCLATIERRRLEDGGWRYRAEDEKGDTSVTAWMMTALSTGERLGFGVSEDALVRTLPFLDRVTDPGTGRVGYDSPGSPSSRTLANGEYPRDAGEALTAAGLWCRLLAGTPSKDAVVKRHESLLMDCLPVWESEKLGNEIYYWYYGTYALFQMGGKSWGVWNEALLTALLPAQVQHGHARGSWDPIGPWGSSGGRVYSTALAALCLEVYFRYAPGFDAGSRSPR